MLFIKARSLCGRLKSKRSDRVNRRNKMGVIAQYQVSVANPSIVGGTSAVLQYFTSNPPQSLWNSGVTEVNAPITNTQLGQTPSSTSALGQLPFDVVAYKLQGGRFRIYASGTASATASTPTLTPIIQYNKGTIATPSYVTLAGNVASGAFVNADPQVGWSVAFDGMYDPAAQSIYGMMCYQFGSQTSGATSSGAAWAMITVIQGVAPVGTPLASQQGFVVGVTFSAGTTGNSASLYEFKIVQD